MKRKVCFFGELLDGCILLLREMFCSREGARNCKEPRYKRDTFTLVQKTFLSNGLKLLFLNDDLVNKVKGSCSCS